MISNETNRCPLHAVMTSALPFSRLDALDAGPRTSNYASRSKPSKTPFVATPPALNKQTSPSPSPPPPPSPLPIPHNPDHPPHPPSTTPIKSATYPANMRLFAITNHKPPLTGPNSLSIHPSPFIGPAPAPAPASSTLTAAPTFPILRAKFLNTSTLVSGSPAASPRSSVAVLSQVWDR